MLANHYSIAMEFKHGDKVYASRKAKGSEVLSAAIHPAKVLVVTVGHRGKNTITVEYESRPNDKYAMYDTIKYIPEGTSRQSCTIVSRDETETSPAQIESNVSKDAAAAAIPVVPVATDVVAVAAKPALERGAKDIPIGFLAANALDIIDIDVPKHIQDRWQLIDKYLRVEELFKLEHRAIKALEGIEIESLKPLCGFSKYEDVPVRTGKVVVPNQGLIEVYQHQKIKGRTMRAKTKGLMFFFLMCTKCDDVVFPPLDDKKRKRQPPFSISEQGRLVAIIAAPENFTIVSMLKDKLDRAELDARAGLKGADHYWAQLATIYNDPKYVPLLCDAFQDYLHANGNEGVYNVKLLPVYRSGLALKKQWKKLRQGYATFYQNYSRSGQNNSDSPENFSTELPVLLMHFTFNDKPLCPWAARESTGGVDDAGDGSVAASSTNYKPKKTKTGKSVVDADAIMAASQVYETVSKVRAHAPPEEREANDQRVSRAGCIMDACLTELECGFGL